MKGDVNLSVSKWTGYNMMYQPRAIETEFEVQLMSLANLKHESYMNTIIIYVYRRLEYILSLFLYELIALLELQHPKVHYSYLQLLKVWSKFCWMHNFDFGYSIIQQNCVVTCIVEAYELLYPDSVPIEHRQFHYLIRIITYLKQCNIWFFI